MIIDVQEYLQEWEKNNNPFYPNEMKWDRLTVNKFLSDYKQQKPIASHAVLGEVPNDIEDILYKGLALCQLAEDSGDKVIISKYIILNFASQVTKIIDKYGLNK